MQRHIVIHTDGGSRGNPGPAAAAYILSEPGGRTIESKGFCLGKTTNNVAEYAGLLRALNAAKQRQAKTICAYTDSELMARQINGQYRVKSPNLRELYADCMQLLNSFDKWEVAHIRRDKNSLADELANRAMDAGCDIDGVSVPAGVCAEPAGKRVRLGVLLSGGGTTLVNIGEQIEAGRLNAEIAVVISSRSRVKGVERARGIGLEPVIIRKKDHPDIEEFTARIKETLDEANVDLVIQAGWLCLWLIPPEYENRVMNIHPALLPSFGGQGMWGHHVHEAVLAAGCKISGCTVHFCTSEYNKGPIIVQRSCAVESDDDADSLAGRVFQEECIAYPEAIRLFAEDRIAVQGRIAKIKPAR